jgi:hypothetical protein
VADVVAVAVAADVVKVAPVVAVLNRTK